jgi:hypothetical protein
MAKSSEKKKKPIKGRIVLRTGEALVEAEQGWSAAEPEVVIGELDGPVGYAISHRRSAATRPGPRHLRRRSHSNGGGSRWAFSH